MTTHFYFSAVFPCLFGVLALLFFGIGLRGIVAKKPFFISARWLFRLFLLIFAPLLLQPFVFPTPQIGGDFGVLLTLLPWLNPIMFLCMSLFMWFALRGYLAFAVTGSSFREGLVASLKKLQLPYEETVGTMRLPSVGADLQVAVQSWIGTGQVKVKQNQYSGVLKDIVKGMNEHYRTSTVKINLISCVFHVVMGVFMAVFGVVMYMAGTLLDKLA